MSVGRISDHVRSATLPDNRKAWNTTEICRAVVEFGLFSRIILAMMLLATVLVEMETYQTIAVPHGELLHLLNEIRLRIFVVEAVLKMVQHEEKFYLYFRVL